jgi:hypothetical protein
MARDRAMLPRLSAAAAVALVACGTSPRPAAVGIAMSFFRGSSFYDAPFPSDDLLVDGTVDISALPDPEQPMLMLQTRALLAGVDGFARAGAVFLQATDAIDPTTLPTLASTISPGASVELVSVDASAADYLQPHPVDVEVLADGGPYGAPNLLSILPLQGAPLGAAETYAAVVTTDVHDADGHALAASPAVAELADHGTAAGLAGDALAHYRTAVAALATAGVAADRIAGLAVFTTGTPTAGVDLVRDAILALPPPAIPPPTIGDQYDGYCVFDTTIEMPDYQTGSAPYTATGGNWTFGSDGQPILDHTELARVVFTIPRGPTPPRGWPLVVFIRTGGGGDRPLVDRGVCATPEFTVPIVPGSGPAQDFAAVGFAGVEVDGPLGGIRNPTGQDEEFLIFNITNPAALRDNIRESAVELDLFAHLVALGSFDATQCAGAGVVTFDTSHVVLMGHSMGAWIAPLVLASDDSLGAAILSGAGGSYVANIVDKQKPVAPASVVGALLNLRTSDPGAMRHDPGITLLQWAAEPSDPQVYTPSVVRDAPQRSVLMIQGIVDHYILPTIADSTSLSLGLDEAGSAYDAGNAELAGLGQPVLATQLPLVGRSVVSLPVANNAGSNTTAVVIQHPADGIEDGHEVIFQTEPPKHQYRCFLASWLAGTPSVPSDGSEDDPCP